jgi:hypothetical protein
MGVWNKIFGSGERNTKSVDEPVGRLMKKFGDEFGDFAVHHAFFHSEADAKTFAHALSFVSEDAEGLVFPKSVSLAIVRYDDGARLLIAGQLSEAQNYEVQKLAHEKRVQIKAYLIAAESSLVYHEFLKAALRVKTEFGSWGGDDDG